MLNESEAYGCKVSLNITHPEWMVMADEVGGNTSQKGDGAVGGRKLLVKKGEVPREKITTRDKHFTLFPLPLELVNLLCALLFLKEKI